MTMKIKMVAYYDRKQEKLTLQRSDYIEDGVYIEVKGLVYSVFEIPQYGGTPQLIKACDTIDEAMDIMGKLT